ncbi:MAG: hypothetical protein JNL05_14900 [Flavobacteriales bacterium]|nr:hypothetical protein [Flavobacteriales bacterium]
MGTEPFHSDAPVTRADLERYLRGGLGDRERHHIERQLERDPLLREALEGLAVPGALGGLAALDQARPVAPGPVMPMLLTGALIVVGLVAVVLYVKEDPHAAPAPRPLAVSAPEQPYRADSAIAVVEQELAVTDPLPAPQQIGHTPTTQPPPVRDTVIAEPATLVPDSAPSLRSTPAPAAVGPSAKATPPRSDRRLAYVHDLKLIDPRELYERGPLIGELGGVPAGFADEREQQDRTEAPRTMRYLDFMDEALGKFARNDHRGCLQDLLFLMGQYPRDINARFYAGLCCYNLGLNERARGYLQAVVDDPMDTFHEEAAWYLALSVERGEGADAARPLFQRIADGGGFHAAQAHAHLAP